MTACNAKEESEWTRRLSQAQEHSVGADICFAGSIDLEIKSQGLLLAKEGATVPYLCSYADADTILQIRQPVAQPCKQRHRRDFCQTDMSC